MSVGQPADLYLQQFGSIVWDVFGSPPYLVGSALTLKTGWRDVDVRSIIDDTEYERWGFGDPNHPERNGKWVGITLAFAELGRKMTGLPIDFQVQQQTIANTAFPCPEHLRSALGLTPDRFKEFPIHK